MNNRLNPNGTTAKIARVVLTVFKEGVTTAGPVDILCPKGEKYDTERKAAFYRSLGYTVTVPKI